MRRLASLQAARGVAAILIVIHHAATFLTDEPSLWHRPFATSWLHALKLPVATFFVLSGMVILTAHWHDLGKSSTVRTFLWRRFRRIYPLYWMVLALVLCGQVIRQQHGAPNGWLVLSSVLLIHIHSQDTILVPAWTLFHEVMFYSIFAIMLLHRRLGGMLIGAWMAVAAVAALLGRPSLLHFVSPLHVLFGFGLAAAWMLRRNRISQPGYVCVAGCLLFLGSLGWSGWSGEAGLAFYLLAGAGSALALLGAAALETQGTLRTPGWLRFFGDASYAIYLLHFPLVSAMARIGYRVDPGARFPLVLWLVGMVVMATAAGCLIHVLLERRLLKWLSTLRWPVKRPATAE